jgi:hypothetical protein
VKRALALVALAACAPAGAPPPPAVVVVVPPPDAAPPPTVVVVVDPPKPTPPAPPDGVPAACSGAKLRFPDVLEACACEWERCAFRDERDSDRVRKHLAVSATGPKEVRAGEPVVVDVRARNTSDEWLVVALDRDGDVSMAWEDDHDVPVRAIEDKTCKAAAMLSMLRAAVVALPPGGVLEGKGSAHATRRREVGPTWKPRNAAERAAVKDLREWMCATIDDGPLPAGVYTVYARLPIVPMSLASFGRAGAPLQVR